MKLFRLCFIAFIMLSAFTSMAANRYWIGSTSSNWNDANNWSATSGGTVGATIPGFTDVVYFDANGSGTCNLDVNASVAAVIMSTGTLNTGAYTFTIGGTSNSTFSGGTINGTNTFNIQPTGTARVTFSGTTFNPDVNVVSPRISLNGSTFNGTSYFEKTGTTDDAGAGGNTFVGDCTIKNTGSRYFMLGNGTDDSFSADLDIINSGSYNIYVAYNNSTTIGGNLTITNDGTSRNIVLANSATSSLNVTGNCSVTNSSTASATLYLSNNGSFTVGGTFNITNGGSGNAYIYLANGSTSTATIAGVSTIINNDTSAVNRVYLGNQGDVTFNGVLNIKNNSNANSSQIYCNNSANSMNTYNENIVVESTIAKCDGIYFGYGGGSGTLASSKTITIGGGGYISGDLQFRNFTQTGGTAQSLTTTGSSRIYNYDSDWGGSIDFKSPRFITRGTTYNGICKLEKTGSGGDQSYGNNTFKGTTEINNSGSSYIMMGNGGTDNFQANLTLNNTGSNSIYFARRSPGITNIAGNFVINNISALNRGNVIVSSDSMSTVVIAGTTTINNSGAGVLKRVYLGTNGDIEFNGDLTIHNSSSSTNSQVYLSYSTNSHNIYNGNIVVESSHANSDGVIFSPNGGSGTLAANKTISNGTFIAGQLYLRNFTQLGTTTAQTLVLTGTSLLTNYDSEWGGNISFTSSRIVTRGTNYHGTAFLEKTGASNDVGVGGNKYNQAVTFKNSGTGSLRLGSGSHDTIISNVTLDNVGTNDIIFAYSGIGHNIGGNLTINNTGADGDVYVSYAASTTLSVAGNTVVVNSGAGSNHRVYLGNVGSIAFGGTIDISNSSSATNSAVYLNNSVGSNNTYAENITLETTNAACDGIYFGVGGGTAVLAATKTVSIKAGGFIAGQLYFRNFTQTGSTNHSLTVTADADLYSRDSDWGGNVIFKSPRMFVYGSTFHGTAYIEKTGAGNDNSAGGNTFMGNVEFVNSSSGYLFFGSGTSSSFLANVTLTNTGTNNIIFARSGAGHSIVGNLDINNTNTGGQVIIADQSSSNLLIGGNTTVINSGGGTNHRVYLGNDGDVVFNGDIDISNSSNATNSAVYIGENLLNSQIVMNGNLSLENTNAASDGVFINAQTATLASGKTISFKTGGFVAGSFVIRNLTQLGSTPVSLTLTGTGYFRTYGSNWGGNISVSSPRLYARNTIFNGTALLEKTGAGDDNLFGANTFKENTQLINSSTGYYFLWSGTMADIFEKDLTITNSGTDDIYLGNNAPGVQVQGNLIINNTARNVYIANGGASGVSITGTVTATNTSGLASSNIYFGANGTVTAGGNCSFTNNATGASAQVILANGSSSSVTITGNTTINNQNGGTTKRIYLGNSGDITLNGSLNITNASTATNSQIYCNSATNSIGTYNGNITVSASGSNCDGIYFGSSGGAATQSAGNNISIGGGGFSDGQLYLRNYTQLGTAAQSLTLTNTGYLISYGSSWGGAVSFTAPTIYLRQSTFNGNATIIKTGTVNSQSYGGNTYNGNTSIENKGNGYLRLASNLANDYNGNLSLIKSGSGTFLPVYNRHSTLAGDLNINTNSDLIIASTQYSRLEFDGAAAQSINNIGAVHNITIRRMMTNNSVSDITLNTPLRVRYNLNLSNGNIITTATNILTMLDNSAVDAVSDNAYVSGPLKKIGNDAFKFPVGGTDTYGHSHYAAIGISAPSSTSTTFIAEYFAAGHANAGTFSAPLTKVSLVEHWDLGRTVGSGSINVYLYWTDGTRSGIGNPTDLRVAHWNGSTWEDKGNDGTTGSAASGAIAANGINSFSPFTFGTVNNVDNPLPIDLLSFDAQKEDESVRIDWTTASEINNDYFIIERTDDFKNIEVIQTVKGAGNSNEILNYFIYDNQPLNGTSYYRLTQVDFDGQQEVFEWKSVNFNSSKEAHMSIYPNPSNTGTATISLTNMNGATDLEVLDIAGRIVYRKSLDLLETNTNIPLNLNLGAGVYIVRIVNNQSTLTQRLIVE